jgi:glycosyltransferase involved in cell wall biosynthesis
LNSLYENQPVVILEALCCGIPVISSEVGGISENINPENGILFKPNDENELVQAIENYIIKKDSYNSLQIQKRAMELYGKNIIAVEFDKLIQSVVKK